MVSLADSDLELQVVRKITFKDNRKRDQTIYKGFSDVQQTNNNGNKGTLYSINDSRQHRLPENEAFNSDSSSKKRTLGWEGNRKESQPNIQAAKISKSPVGYRRPRDDRLDTSTHADNRRVMANASVPNAEEVARDAILAVPGSGVFQGCKFLVTGIAETSVFDKYVTQWSELMNTIKFRCTL